PFCRSLGAALRTRDFLLILRGAGWDIPKAGPPPSYADAASAAIRSVAAPDIADNAPAPGLLAVAEPVRIGRQQGVRRREAGFSARGGHACPGIARRVGIAGLFPESEHADA